nr:MAG TPA: Toll-like receptor 3 domain, dimer, IMMUNE SYSTEM [Caudoviricetes sp.]
MCPFFIVSSSVFCFIYLTSIVYNICYILSTLFFNFFKIF